MAVCDKQFLNVLVSNKPFIRQNILYTKLNLKKIDTLLRKIVPTLNFILYKNGLKMRICSYDFKNKFLITNVNQICA